MVAGVHHFDRINGNSNPIVAYPKCKVVIRRIPEEPTHPCVCALCDRGGGGSGCGIYRSSSSFTTRVEPYVGDVCFVAACVS